MYKYRHERIFSRMEYLRYVYTHREAHSSFENFMFPVVVYGRDGTIEAASKEFREIAKIEDGDIPQKKANIFDYIDNEDNYGLEEAVRMAFRGVPNVYISDTRIIRSETGSSEAYISRQYPNAIFYPMTYDGVGVKLVGILLDDNKTAEGETID